MKTKIIYLFLICLLMISISSWADSFENNALDLIQKYKNLQPAPVHNETGNWNNIMHSNRVDPMVNCMPYYYSWVGREITIWGNVHWGDDETGTYEWDVDGTIYSGTVTDARYIAVSHTFNTGGLKTATLTVTDGLGNIDVDQVSINVIPIVDKQQRINAAIEDGLRWLYLNQYATGYWYTTGEYGVGTTGLAVLAFEENGHHGNNDLDEDIYAETVQLGLDWIVNSNGTTIAIGTQPAGDPDTDGDGIGVYFSGSVYANGIACLAVAAGDQPDKIIETGALAGMTYYEAMEDAMNGIAWNQTDDPSAGRGGWRYNTYYDNYGSSDNSAVQWPVLALHAIEENTNDLPFHDPIIAPSWVADELQLWLEYSVCDNGSFGYTYGNYWPNNAKTVSGMASHYYLETAQTADVIQNALDYLDIHWTDPSYDGSWYAEMFYGNYYALYGLKKAMEFYDITTFGTGPRDWYEDVSDYLLDDPSYGQYVDGNWPNGANWFTFTHGTTAVSVLVLTRGVVTLQPVAVIRSSSLPQPTDTPITFSGQESYHQDIEEFITTWEWDFDASDGIDWDNPDDVGDFVTHQYADEGTYEVTLRVTGSDDVTDTDTHFTTVDNGVNHAPIADPGGPYAATVGETITLDGSNSYDPDDGDFITAYSWDTNGDGVYGDADTETTDVVYDQEYSGLIGLRVWDNFDASSDSTAPIYVTLWTSNLDLEITENGVTTTTQGDNVTIEAQIYCYSENGSTADEFVVRFYEDDPSIFVNPIGEFTLGPMSNGDIETVSLDWTIPDLDIHSVYIRVDADEEIEEYDEENNEVILFFAPEVWPGDTDNNGVVDEYDIEPIGVYWRDQGNPRIATSFEWTGHAYPGGWDDQAAAYSDCNGDGSVNITDVLGLLVNWNETHTTAYALPPLVVDYNEYKDNYLMIYNSLGDSEIEIKIKNHIELLLDMPITEEKWKNHLFANYPNPFNPTTSISYSLAEEGDVHISIYNVKGQLIKELVNDHQDAGEHSVIWNGDDNYDKRVSSGIYFYKLQSAGKLIDTRKMVLLK